MFISLNLCYIKQLKLTVEVGIYKYLYNDLFLYLGTPILFVMNAELDLKIYML